MTVLGLAVTGRGAVDPREPVVRADDEAVLRGRAAFETLRVYGGRPFRLGAHLDRLTASAERLALPPVDHSGLTALAGDALAAARAGDAVLRLLWTPGGDGSGPMGIALVSAIPPHIEAWRGRGLRLASLRGVRADAPWLLGGVKSTSYAVNIAAEAEARGRGADDAVFVDGAGTVLECPVSNVWWRVGELLFTPSLDLGVLAGVTRDALVGAAPALGYEVVEGRFPISELAAADEAFTSSSVREVLPVVELDGAAVGDGAPGPAAAELQAALRAEAGA